MKAEITAGGMLRITADTDTELFALNQWGPAPFKVDVETHEEFMEKRKAEWESVKNKTCSIEAIKHMFDKAYEEADAGRAEMCRDNEFWNKRAAFVYRGFSIHEALAAKAAHKPKEKTYSQADMDGAHKIIDNLLNENRTQKAREKEFLLLHQNALEEEQGSK